MTKKGSTWLSLAALFLFAAATFRIADGSFITGAVFFGAAACFTAAAAASRKKEKDETQEGAESA